MEENKNGLFIFLINEDNDEELYEIEQIFDMAGTEQMYCGAVPVGGNLTDIIFLRCQLSRNDETTEITVSDIPDTAEYSRVSAAYHALAVKSAVESTHEALSDYEDYITLTDKDGNKVDFIIHTIYEDEENHRFYVAMQKVDDAGEIVEEIALYRFEEDNGKSMIEMISSDMEYERARKLFMELIEN